MKFDKDEIKNSLTIEQVFELIAELGGEPIMDKSGTFFISKTICHNHMGKGSHKLYYYDNTHLFKCFTSCNDTFDLFQLILKIKALEGIEWSLPKAILYIANYFGIAYFTEDFENFQYELQDWEVLNKYHNLSSVQNNKQIVELKNFDKKILKHLPHPRIIPWEEEGITREVMEHRGICYDPCSQGIVIPHYDIDGNLIGIRERTLIKEEEKYGKYKPAYLNGKLYNHPLSFNLYNLNYSNKNIRKIKKVIIGEGEKFCLKYASWFGEENDITVACCGSSLISHQVQLLLSLGVEEIIIAFDKQWKEKNDEEFKKWVKKLTDINKKYSPYVQVSFMFDKDGDLLGYKESPVDKTKEIFIELFKRRIIL